MPFRLSRPRSPLANSRAWKASVVALLAGGLLALPALTHAGFSRAAGPFDKPKPGKPTQPGGAAPAAPAVPPSPSTPGQPPVPGSPAAPALTPEGLPTRGLRDLMIKRSERAEEWSLNTEVTIGQLTSVVGGFVVDNRTNKAINLSSAVVIFPAPTRTAWHDLAKPGVTGTLMFDGVDVARAPTLIEGYPAGARFAKWQSGQAVGTTMRLRATVPVLCFSVVVDESLAVKVPWPKTWPAPAATALEPQFGVEYTQQMGYIKRSEPPLPPPDKQIAETQKEIAALLKNITGGKDPKSIPPYTLAKFLTQQVLQRLQINGNGENVNRDRTFQGFDLQGALATLRSGRGSRHDIACALVAVMRQAGLPARTVIALDVRGERDKRRLSNRRDNAGERLVTLVEFALVDPTTGEPMWVPINVEELKKRPSATGDLDRAWEFFAVHDDLDAFVPVAFQFHPPTTVSAFGSAALWGWNPQPEVGALEQSIRFNVGTTPKTDNVPGEPLQTPGTPVR